MRSSSSASATRQHRPVELRAAEHAHDALRAARADLRPLRRSCSPSARIRAGAASSSRASTRGRATACSTSPPAPAPSRASSLRRNGCARHRHRPERRDARGGRARALTASGRLVEGRAESLPFDDATFDALTFTYLLRYVDDPAATLRELARVVRPGGTIAMLEFGLPRGVWRPLWELYVRVGLPARRPR